MDRIIAPVEREIKEYSREHRRELVGDEYLIEGEASTAHST
jgi:hypothetical protein